MRIIAGKHKGLNLFSFEFDNIRPTSDRVRESIFNKIQFSIKDADFLDLFCGTGAMSLEAISRGAKNVVSVENNINTINLIKRNFNKAKENLKLLEMPYYSAIKKLSGSKFDFIYLDPPYKSGYYLDAVEKIIQRELLKKDGMIIVEHNVNDVINLETKLKKIDSKKFGTIIVDFWGLYD